MYFWFSNLQIIHLILRFLGVTVLTAALVGCSEAAPGTTGVVVSSGITRQAQGAAASDVTAPTNLPPLLETTPVVTSTTGLVVSTKIVYYQVFGATPSQLSAQMDRFGPLDSQAVRRVAITDWTIKWNFRYATSGGKCSIEALKIVVDLIISLPRWEQSGESGAPLLEKWNSFVLALQNHEEGHREIAIKGGYEVQQTISAVPATPSCKDLEQTANTAGYAVIDQVRQRQVKYDLDTKHGITQGTHFP